MQENLKKTYSVLPSGEKILSLHHYPFEEGTGESYCAKLDTGCLLMAICENEKITCYKKSYQGDPKNALKEPLHENLFSTLAALFKSGKTN